MTSEHSKNVHGKRLRQSFNLELASIEFFKVGTHSCCWTLQAFLRLHLMSLVLFSSQRSKKQEAREEEKTRIVVYIFSKFQQECTQMRSDLISKLGIDLTSLLNIQACKNLY